MNRLPVPGTGRSTRPAKPGERRKSGRRGKDGKKMPLRLWALRALPVAQRRCFPRPPRRAQPPPSSAPVSGQCVPCPAGSPETPPRSALASRGLSGPALLQQTSRAGVAEASWGQLCHLPAQGLGRAPTSQNLCEMRENISRDRSPPALASLPLAAPPFPTWTLSFPVSAPTRVPGSCPSLSLPLRGPASLQVVSEEGGGRTPAMSGADPWGAWCPPSCLGSDPFCQLLPQRLCSPLITGACADVPGPSAASGGRARK